MRISCLIDSLGSGGAQRQMTWLVKALIDRGHDIQLLTYFESDHFLPQVKAVGVRPESIATSTKVGRIFAARKKIRQFKADIIVAYLRSPSIVAVLAGLAPAKIPVVVSERAFEPKGPNWRNRLRFNIFRWANAIVSNSHSQAEFIRNDFAFLDKKLHTIINCVDLERFKPSSRPRNAKFRVIVGASFIARKNAKTLVRALDLAKRESSKPIEIHWYGDNRFCNEKPTANSQYFLETMELVENLKLTKDFIYHSTVSNLHELMPTFDACCLPSFNEGTPNVICEAMACGLPVLGSDVGDHKILIGSENGFRFDPTNAEDLASKLVEVCSLSDPELVRIGKNNRKHAEREFHPEVFTDRYDKLLRSLC